MLASDVANPEFVGAYSPDSRLTVQFYSKPVEIPFQTEKQGRPIFEDRTYVKIFTPGDNLNQIDRPKRDDDEQRFPLQWAQYKNKNVEQVVGTPISQWPLVSASKAEELKYMKFFTVESIAFASDEQISHLGMIAGMQPMAFREKAKQFLAVSQNASILSEREAQLKQQQELMAAQAEQLKIMQEQINALQSKKKPGRPPKQAHSAAA